MNRRRLREEHGNDLIEYALLAAFISIVSLLTIQFIGPRVAAFYQVVAGKIEGRTAGTPPPEPRDH